MPTLTVATFNAENFSLLLDRPYSRRELDALSESDYQAMNASIYNRNKDRSKIARIAQILNRHRFDVVGLIEVGGMETLESFNRIFLRGRYDCYLHEERSKRGIYVGALVRKGRFPGIVARSVGGPFSRNVLRLDLGASGANTTVYLVHLKSQMGSSLGLEQRVLEVEWLSRTVSPHRCVVAGDFNGIAMRGEHQFEYEPFLKLPFVDVLEAVGTPRSSRRTHYHFGKRPHFAQLDYVFCSNDLTVLDGGTIEGEIPVTREQRDLLPSDHLPIWAKVRLPRVRARGVFAWLRARLCLL